MKTPAIKAIGLAKSYNNQTILKDVNLHVASGTIFALLGPNGAGKTTTVRILSTLTPADAGQIEVAGYDISVNPRAVREAISLTGQYAAVDEKLTGRENLHMIGELRGIGRRTIQQHANELLDQFDLSSAADKVASTYSGGMRRKLDLAMSLISSPNIIFLDEPTTGLDPRSRKSMWQIIGNLKKKGVTIFLTTQYLEEADQLADMVAVINNGTVVATGTPNDLKSKVGERSLRLTFASRVEATNASTLFDTDDIVTNQDPTIIDIKTDGSVRRTKEIMDVLAASPVKPLDMSFHKPSLDDVFFELTGSMQQKEATDED